MSMGKVIAQKREEADMTQAELGRRIGVTSQAVNQWESGKSQPLLDNLRALASVFGCPVADLLGEPAGKSASACGFEPPG